MERQIIGFIFIFGLLDHFITKCEAALEDEEDVERLLNWKPNIKLQKGFPYYLSGHDKHGRPIWVMECGKYDLKTELEAGEKRAEDFNRFGNQMFARFKESTKSNDTMEYYANPMFLIVDYEGFTMTQLASLPVMQFAVKQSTRHGKTLDAMAHKVYILNANIAAETLISVIKPIVGMGDRMEVYGTNSARWKPILVKNLPKNQLPTWYGGTLDAKHLAKVYG